MMDKVKIVACSDIHGCVSCDSIADYAIRHRADILVIAGDIQNADLFRPVKSYFNDDFVRSIRRLMDHGIEVVAVPGNHDFYLNDCLSADSKRRFMSNLHILVDRMETVSGIRFYGTPWVPTINGRWVYEENDDDLEVKFSKIPTDLDVLISHSPPLGFSDAEQWDVSLQRPSDARRHFGSRSLRKSIISKKPRLNICGHIHTGDHHPLRLDGTVVMNVSLLDERYKEAFLPSEIKIFKDGGNMEVRMGGDKTWQKVKCNNSDNLRT